MSDRIDIRLTLPEELSERLRSHVSTTYGGQKGALTLTISQAIKEFLDKRGVMLPVIGGSRRK